MEEYPRTLMELEQWGQLGEVAEIVDELAAGERRSTGGFGGLHLGELVFLAGLLAVGFDPAFEDVEFGGLDVCRCRKRLGRGQSAPVVVLEFEQAAAEDGGKDGVDGIEDLGSGAEIIGQVDLAEAGFSGRVGGEVEILKNFRLGEAEAVDALFDVTDHEHVLDTAG